MDNNEEAEKIKQQTQEVVTLLATAKQEILAVQTSLVGAKQIVTSIEAYGKKLADSQALFDDPENGFTAYNTKAKAKKEEIDALKSTSDAQLNQINTALSSVQGNIKKMKEEYASFEAVNLQIKNPETGLAAVLVNATKLNGEIDVLKNASTEQLEKIKAALLSVQKNVQEMTDAYTGFLEIKAKIDHPETGLLKILETSGTTKSEISAVKKLADDLHTEIKQFRNDSQKYTNEIETLKKTSGDNNTAILGYEEESRGLRAKILGIYKIALDTTLANSFDKRKEELKKSTVMWLVVIASSTLLLILFLIVFILVPVIKKEINPTDVYTWYRLTISSPLIFFIVFASIQYGKDRNLLEKYAFKAATALSLEGYTTLLINTFGKDDKKIEGKILEFVLSSMNAIYQQPFDPIKESKVALGVDGKFANFKADFSKTMDNPVTKTTKEEIVKTTEDTITTTE